MGISPSSFGLASTFSSSQKKHFLRASPFFVHMTEAQLDLLVECFVPRVVRAHTVIPYSEKLIMLVGQGEVRVSMLIPDFANRREGKLFLCIKRAGDVLNPAASMKRAKQPLSDPKHHKIANMLSELHMLAVGDVVLLHLKKPALEVLAGKNKDIQEQIDPLLGTHLIDNLRHIPFISNMRTEGQVELFAEMCRYEVLDADTTLFNAGDEGNYFYILTKGRCEVRTQMVIGGSKEVHNSLSIFDCEGKKVSVRAASVLASGIAPNGMSMPKTKTKLIFQRSLKNLKKRNMIKPIKQTVNVVLNTLKPGDYFGEAALLMDVPRTTAVVTIEKCLFIKCEKTFFKNIMKVAPELKMQFQLAMFERILGKFRFTDHPYLQMFEESQLGEVATYCQLEEFINGDVVFKRGENVHSVYFIIYGNVRLELSESFHSRKSISVRPRANSFSEFRYPEMSLDNMDADPPLVNFEAPNSNPGKRAIYARMGQHIGQESLSHGAVTSTAVAMGRCVLLRLDGEVHKVLKSNSALGAWNILAKRHKCRLRDVLRCYQASEAFKYFLEKERSGENLRFIRAVQKCKEQETDYEFITTVKGIIEEYIKEGSPSQVNISNNERNNILQEIQNATISREFFDESFKEVYLLMERDSFKRFIKSELFLEVVDKLGASSDLGL